MNNRLADGGRIDRERILQFQFDGQTLHGHPGDTLASALLANGVRVVGRSFKYHRPRGLMTAGGEEPNGLVRLRRGGRAEPNVRATEVALYDGLVAESQNRWPNLKYDLGALNDRLSPLFPAGFYYKTFMWPASLWPAYEAVIRRMAGLGRVAEAPDPDIYEKQYAHCDVLVVGGGPAGLAAALWAGRTGARVILADEGAELGGALLGNGQRIDDAPGMDWVAGIEAELGEAENIRLLPRTTVTGYYDHNALVMLQRVSDHLAQPDHGQPRQRLWQVRAKQVVLATGALERPLVLANNDRPGVMAAAAAQTYINRYGVRLGKRAVLFTNNDSAYPVALDLARAGVEVAALVELRPTAPLGWLSRLDEEGIEVMADRAVVAVEGQDTVTGVRTGKLNEAGDGLVRGLGRRLACDLFCYSGGWTPSLHLLSQSGAKLNWNDAQGCFLPGEATQAVQVVGAANGDDALQACLDLGAEAGNRAANQAGKRRRGRGPRKPVADDSPDPTAPLPIWSLPGDGRGKAFVDFQSDVTANDLRLAAREGYRSIEHVKRYTTTGMGTDQGRTSNINALAIVAEALDVAVPQVGHTTFRPPFSPVTFGALAGRRAGGLLEPVRRTPMHGWHQAQGAAFEPVGQWLRPYYYPRNGEAMDQAVDREVLAARTSLGLMDATTLGKIDIQGPDAAEFLNRIYTNGWKGLAVGGCRYGLMLGEDGMVFDDGVTSRLGQDHFHMTTTSGNAARVLDWLESWLQTEWPELAVYCTSCTEQWAVASLCGPNARALMQELSPEMDLSGRAFPAMTWQSGMVAGIEARIFRIGFTGELSFEINVPAGHGPALWQAIMAAGEKYAITPFGTEAMHVLRAEVGFIMVGQETDGTVTPHDLGLGRMVSRKKDFLGKRSLSRADTARADRPQLVGLLSDDPELRLPEGAQLIPGANPAPPQVGIGHVTSSYYSPNLGRAFALAVLQGGHERHGEALYVAYDGRAARAVVTAPQFLEPRDRLGEGGT
ncbi:MAG: sarcosine oxidase subunit alpha family protein [Alphaproteobacteria bacterium]|nr:sarcosine oxidase subunit alpha family protein [Alphaproteobacteria bacterium]